MTNQQNILRPTDWSPWAFACAAARGALLLALLLVFPLLLSACQAPGAAPTSPPAATRAGSIAPLSIQDPCANRLHDLGGLLLLYAAVHQQLPPNLEALRPYVDAGQTLQVTCPVSGRPYVYQPLGLTAPGDPRRIVLYDATPHQGYREALILTPDVDNKAPIFDVKLVTDENLRALRAPEFK